MKQYIKYIFILLLVLVLHDGATTTNNSRRMPNVLSDTECCFLSEAPTTTQQAIQEVYRQLNTLSLCLDHTDHKRVPSVKCILLWAKYLLAEGGSNSPEWHQTYLTDIHPYCNPQDYYIFQLKKIVI